MSTRRVRVSSAGLAGVLLFAAAATPAWANEIWVTPTYQQDTGGLGVGSNAIWPVTAAGVARLAWAIPNDLQTFRSARLVLIPQAAAAGATLTLFVCRATASEPVDAACAGPLAQPFSSVANQLLEVDISAVVGPRVGSPGQNHLAIVAYTTPTIATDRILGLRFAYDPVRPPGTATLGANTFTGTQIAPAFVGSGAGLTNLPFPAGAATLAANTFAGTQTIHSGHLDLDASSAAGGNLTKNGTLFLHSIQSGTYLGLDAGNLTMAGVQSTGIGRGVLQFNAAGDNNAALGHFALHANTSGDGNAALGSSALTNNQNGVSNVGVGAGALNDNVGGDLNTGLGSLALSNSTGSSNTALGANAGAALSSGDHNIYIKNGGAVTESGTIRIGTTNQTRAFINGIRGVTTGQNNAVAVVIDAAGQLGTVSSSRRYKEDIRDMASTSSRLLQLRPVTFRYTRPFADGGQPVQYGLIAEEVGAVFPELVVRDEEGRPETVQYHTLSVLLLNEVQKLQRERANELRKLRTQQDRLDALEREVAAIRRDRR